MEIISETSLVGAKPISTPLESNSKLTLVEYDEAMGCTRDAILKDATYYQRLLGKLKYVIVTRPDINYVVQWLSQFMKMPKRSYLETIYRVVRNLKASVGQDI